MKWDLFYWRDHRNVTPFPQGKQVTRWYY